MSDVIFQKIALIGLGLIGSSLGHAIKRGGLAAQVAGHARSSDTRQTALDIGFVDSIHESAAEACADADLVMLCVPLGVYGDIARAIAPALKSGALVSDVGSVKATAIRDVAPHLCHDFHFIPGNKIAVT